MALALTEACPTQEDLFIGSLGPVERIQDAYSFYTTNYQLIEDIQDRYELIESDITDRRFNLIEADTPQFNLSSKDSRGKMDKAWELLDKAGEEVLKAYGMGPEGTNNDNPNMTPWQRTMKDCATLFGGMAISMDGILVYVSTPREAKRGTVPEEVLEILAGIALVMHGHMTRRNPSKLAYPREQLGLLMSGAALPVARYLQNPHDRYLLTASALVAIASAVYAYKLHKAAEKELKG